MRPIMIRNNSENFKSHPLRETCGQIIATQIGGLN